jgi:hypothetical protein
MENPFFGIALNIAPDRYELRHYRGELATIAAIFEREFAALPEDEPPEDGEADEQDDEPSPRKRLAAQRSQAMGAASKRLSRGVALRFILDCKNQGLPMTVHLATRLLADLFAGYAGRSSVSESTLVEFAGGGPEARRNAKLDLDEVRAQVIDQGLVRKHRRLLKAAKTEADAIREAVKRG